VLLPALKYAETSFHGHLRIQMKMAMSSQNKFVVSMANAFKKTAHSKARHVTFQESFPTSKLTHFGHRLLPPLPRRSRHRPMTVRPTATSPSCFGAASRSERQGRMTTPDWRRLLRLRRLAAARLRKAGVRRRSREFCPKQRKASMGNGLWLEGKQAGAFPVRVARAGDPN